jgi:hypothetical protein
MFLSMMLLLSSPSLAGKLADGFRGIPYGPASVLDTAPGESCTAGTQEGARWVCQVQVGEVAVEVAYMVKENLFYGVHTTATGYMSCSAYFDVLSAAYGPGTPANTYDKSALADHKWSDGEVIGSWEYNKYSDKGVFLAFHRAVVAQIDRIETERAKAAASGL